MEKILFIGCGNMGSAIIKGLVQSKNCEPSNIFCCDSDKEKLELLKNDLGVNVCATPGEVIGDVGVVVLAVKPNMVKKVLFSMQGDFEKLKSKTLLISIAAGVNIAVLESLVGARMDVVRVMPNLPATINCGVSAIYGKDADQVYKTVEIFSTVGTCVLVNSDNELDAATALSASGPGFAFLLIEALTQGGVRMGLTPATAGILATEMLRGSAAMVTETGEHPAVLRDKVTTPGGTTIAGLKALEEGGVRAAIIAAIEAAALRARELSQNL